ncbi:MAG: glycosyltransferase [Verrucomicrobia bacterium]|jgi:glycosyltransferase involved in cell wall biosynthesis|nr:glycosyltransferase [Verrucomicrobiota bacterium]
MKLIVQIPCFNEAETLAQTVADIPRVIPGLDTVELLIIDDGSTDNTIDVAREVGVDHIVRHKRNRGLARSFRTGLDACLSLGADIIVNTDGDNQYCGQDIPELVRPILEGRADLVLGDRRTDTLDHFSPLKKKLQRFGSFAVRQLSDTEVPDAVSGFRAFSRDAALQLNIVSSFSYTIETVIQAGKKHMAIACVPVRTNPKTRDSRLFKSIPKFLERSATTMIRMYSMYQPLRFFVYMGVIMMFIGLVPVIRFLIEFFLSDGGGHIQSLILGGALIVMGVVTFLIGLVSDLINFNRQLIEITLEKVRRIELNQIREQKENKKTHV